LVLPPLYYNILTKQISLFSFPKSEIALKLYF